ncbi:MAG TPA: transglycosylase domain-containing protein, partial [Geminicoccaceae bacterium]|nr:transglycosylase domain-containing protein [Geminicoccaceae bacterium]
MASVRSAPRRRASKQKTAVGGARGRRLRWLLSGPLGLLLVIVLLGWYTSLDVADLKRPSPGERNPQITLLDREGVAFASFGNRYGEYLTLEQISPWFPKAVVAIEDRRFWHHPGLDPIGIFRALVENLKAGRVVQGGSTISQQLAKLAFLTPERSITRKIKEALYTLWLEARLPKQEILEAYLNRLYLGSGAYGVDAAARRYFAKPASELTLAESALLAGVIRAPSYYAPTRDLGLARQRAAVVLDAMVETGAASAKEVAEAKSDPATLAAPPMRADAGYFADWVVAESRLYADEEQRQLRVKTTLDQRIQAAAEAAVKDVFARTGAEVEQAALVAMTPDGRVRAMLGGRAYAQSQFNRATQAERQPGSAFKLFVYLAALEKGLRPESAVSGAPIAVGGWQPRNDGNAYPDQLTLMDAFAMSVNTAAVRLSEQIGRQDVLRIAERLGITSDLRDDPSLALGSSEVRLIELTGAYASIANGGRLVWPEAIEGIEGSGDKVLYRRRAVDEPVLEPSTVRAMTAMLEIALRRGTGRQAAL